jgi:hypothetical protein
MTAQAVVEVGPLPDEPLAAAAAFYRDVIPRIEENLRTPDRVDKVIVFEPAGHEHHAWRLAAVQALARAAAPGRVNAVDGDDETAWREAVAFLENAPGVTGQLLAVDGISRPTGYMGNT